MSANNPVFSSYRNTRKIANMLIRASKLIKQCCFTAILITRQCEGKSLVGRQRMTLSSRMKYARLTRTRMRARRKLRIRTRNIVRIVDIFKLDKRCIVIAQGKLITTKSQLKRIAHRRALY